MIEPEGPWITVKGRDGYFNLKHFKDSVNFIQLIGSEFRKMEIIKVTYPKTILF